MDFLKGMGTAAGVSTVLGFLSLLAYLYYSYASKQAEGSIRGLLVGERQFSAKDVIRILERFKTDDARLRALETVTSYGRSETQDLLTKVKSKLDVEELTKVSPNKSGRVSLALMLFFFALALVAAAYSWRSTGPGPVPTPTPGPSPIPVPDPAPGPGASAAASAATSASAPAYAFRWVSTSPTGQPLQFAKDIPTENRHGRSDIIASGTVTFPPELQGPPEKRIREVIYSCIGDRCSWSYNPDPRKGYQGSFVIADDGKSFTWSRRWDGDPTTDTYTVKYEVAERYCKANCP